MKTLKTLLLALLISSLSMACKKDKKDQPTQIGANKMYAKVNGVAWQNKACWGCISGGGAINAIYEDGTLWFSVAGENNDQKTIVYIIIKELKSLGSYQLKSRDLNYGYIFKNDLRYYTKNNNIGVVTITKIDLANKIIAGTFEFTAEDENNPGNTIKVTDGWFDIVYKTFI